MGSFIVKQPNGLYCRFSTVVDCPTDWNMNADDYIELCKEKAEKEAIDVLKNYIRPFEWVEKYYYPNNMSREEFKEFLEDVNTPVSEVSTNIGLIEDEIYPLTIINDRYSGTYSGGKFTAWNVEANEIPESVNGDDITCLSFWDSEQCKEYTIGIGNTIKDAVADLYCKMKKE